MFLQFSYIDIPAKNERIAYPVSQTGVSTHVSKIRAITAGLMGDIYVTI